MNKEFMKKVRKSLLTLLLLIALLAPSIPGGIAQAKSQEILNTAALIAEDGYGYTIDDEGKAVYTSGPKLRVRSNLDDYEYTAGDSLDISVETSIDTSSISVLICNTNNVYENLGTLDKAPFELPQSSSLGEDTPAKYVRFQTNAGAEGDYFKLISLTISRGEDEEETPKEEEEPSKPEAGISILESDGYNLTRMDDGSVKVAYNPGSWHTLNIDVPNCDFEKNPYIYIDITPFVGMNLGILDTDGTYYRNHWGGGVFTEDTRQVLTLKLEKNITGLVMYCDPPTGAEYSNGDTSFIIHSISFSDPNKKEQKELVSKATFTTFSAEDACSIDSQNPGGYGQISYAAGGRIKLRSLFENYTYKAGDVLVINYQGIDDIASLEQVILGYGTSTNQYVTLSKPEVSGNTAVYTLPSTTNFEARNPEFIRFKAVFSTTQTSTAFNGISIYDELEYKEYISGGQKVYTESQCPKGVAVSYYTDIYSRGFAWSTDGDVLKNSLEYVKADQEMDAKDINWDEASVVEATLNEVTDVDEVTWHLFKAHVTDLEKNTKYFFRVGDYETGYSKTGSFLVADESSNINGVTFVHITDCQEGNQLGYTKWANVLDAAYKMAPDSRFIAFTGDLTNDSHAYLNMNQWIWGLDEPSKNLLNTVIEPSSGNHDAYDFSFTNRFDIDWADYDNGDITDQKSGGCYSYTYGDDIVFINLNTNESNGGMEEFGPQLKWLENQLETYKDYKWKIVQVHKGMMSGGNHTNDGEVDWLREILPPLFAKYKVDLVLQGHDHVYTRSRSYYYGKDFDGNDYDGLTPVWLDGKIIPDYNFKDQERMVNLEPNGTHYVTINYCASKSYAVEANLDEVIFGGDNPIEGNGCIIQPKLPMYGVVQIDGDTLIYDAYTFDAASGASKLYDTFAVNKQNKAAYDPENRNEGKEEVCIKGIKVLSKAYDGKPVKLDISGFVSDNPEVMDYTTFDYVIRGVDGTDYNSTKELPKDPGKYELEVSISTRNRYYYGSQMIAFSID